MPRVRTRMPTVFIGHPFGNRFPTNRFRKIFKDLPFNVIYGNTDLQTKHILQIMKASVAKSDFSIFDLSGWNPNVALELGCTEGLKRNAAKDYYILLNSRRSIEVPSDIRGLQRLEYTSYDFKPEVGLGDALVKYVLAKEYWVKKIWKEISGSDKSEKKRLLALRILAHLRDHEKLSLENLKSLVRGTRLRKTDRDQILSVLQKHRLIRKIGRTNVYRKGRKIFKHT
jgi:hypothetical protein